MNFDFWKARWDRQHIGFHLEDFNPNLIAHSSQWLDSSSPDADLPLSNTRVLVPLCGKARDMRWLADRGATVTGIEFVETAARTFFAEQDLPFVEERLNRAKALVCAAAGVNLRVLVADFFALEPSEVGAVDAVYDRAALVAVEPRTRSAYADQLAKLTRRAARLLLITIEHDIGSGPPFSVTKADVQSLLGETFAPRLVADVDLLPTESHFRQRGASYCREQVWLGQRV